MLDFDAVREKRITFDELTRGLTRNDLCTLTNEMVDTMLHLIRDCTDEDVTFQPIDPHAHDPYADAQGDVNVAWTLAHVIVHATASAEEAAFLAAEMARGVEYHGRSRFEVPWESVTTIAQCRARLEESRRMRLASLQMWPNTPYTEVTFQWAPGKPVYTAVGRFVLGLRHDDAHLGQIADIVRQARAEREALCA